MVRPHPGCTVTPAEGYFRKFRRQTLFLEAPSYQGPGRAPGQRSLRQTGYSSKCPGVRPAQAGSRQRPQ